MRKHNKTPIQFTSFLKQQKPLFCRFRKSKKFQLLQSDHSDKIQTQQKSSQYNDKKMQNKRIWEKNSSKNSANEEMNQTQSTLIKTMTDKEQTSKTMISTKEAQAED